MLERPRLVAKSGDVSEDGSANKSSCATHLRHSSLCSQPVNIRNERNTPTHRLLHAHSWSQHEVAKKQKGEKSFNLQVLSTARKRALRACSDIPACRSRTGIRAVRLLGVEQDRVLVPRGTESENKIDSSLSSRMGCVYTPQQSGRKSNKKKFTRTQGSGRGAE